MATTYKILGQAATTSATEVALITAQASPAVVSTISVANRGASATTFTIRVAVNNAAVDNKQYISFEVALAAKAFATLTLGITLAAGDTVYVASGTSSTVSFNAFGSLIS